MVEYNIKDLVLGGLLTLTIGFGTACYFISQENNKLKHNLNSRQISELEIRLSELESKVGKIENSLSQTNNNVEALLGLRCNDKSQDIDPIVKKLYCEKYDLNSVEFEYSQ